MLVLAHISRTPVVDACWREADGETFEAGAWYCPEPKDGSFGRAGKDFASYVAFYPQISVSE